LLILGLILSITELYTISRQFIIGIVFIPAAIEMIIGLLQKYPKDTSIPIQRYLDRETVHYRRIFASFIFLSIALITVIYVRYQSFTSYALVEQLTFLLISLWLATGFSTRKFIPVTAQNIYYKISPIIKSQILMLLLAGVVYFLFELNELSRKNLFGIIILFAVLESFFFSVVFIRRSLNNTSTTKLNQDLNIKDQELLESLEKEINADPIRPLLENLSWFDNDKLTQFLENEFSAYGFNKEKTIIYSTRDVFNFQTIAPHSLSLVMNMHRMNDMKNINAMLIAMSNTLVPGGLMVGCVSPLEEDYGRLREKMPKFIFTLVYPFHFLIFRIFPKLPILGDFYEFTTQGIGRFLSIAEMFGRLGFCGFSMVSSKIIQHQLYFIACKDKSPSVEPHPSYGPIIRLTRIGLNGAKTKILKFRTMHPYSEFIQEKVYRDNQLNENGKINDDFRRTKWGLYIRRYWIDELPQIYNWLRGDLKLVGVRALSLHYFNLYPKDLQELRIKYKPGLIPPYYADLPNSFTEILDSERQYLIKKAKNPIKTDVVYLWRAFNNIVFKGARSG